MSVSVMAWVWKHGPETQSERMVLLAIADHADDDGKAFPSMAGIAAKSCLGERGARKVIRRLEAAGWLKTEVGAGRGNKSLYTVCMVEKPEPACIKPEPETRNTVPHSQIKGEPACIKGEPACPKRGTPVPPNHQGTIKEPSEAKKRGKTSGKGSRLPADWTLTKSLGVWAMGEGLSEDDVRTEAEKFRDYWSAKAGAGATKLDWAATWRNWVRKAVADRKAKPRFSQQGPTRAAFVPPDLLEQRRQWFEQIQAEAYADAGPVDKSRRAGAIQ